MNITYIVGVFPKLSETFVLEQITNLIDKGHNVEIIALNRSEENLVHDDVIKYDILSNTHYAIRNESSLGFELTDTIFSILLFTDLIHVHFATEPADIALNISRICNIPFILTAHAYDIYVDPERNMLREKFKRAARVVTVSKYNKNYLLKMLGDEFEKKIDVIRCGIDLHKYQYRLKEPGGLIKILFVGRLVEKKGALNAIKMVHEVIKKHPNVQLRIIGDGPLKEEAVTMINGLRLQDKVIVLGSQNSSVVLREMKNADIFALPSVTAQNGDREGVPVAIMEAQATGLPVISTRHSGIPEVVIDGKTGFLSQEHDIYEMVEKICTLIEKPDTRIAMGKEGRRHIEAHFNQKTEIEKLENLFEAIMQDKILMSTSSKSQKHIMRERIRIIHQQCEQRDYQNQQTQVGRSWTCKMASTMRSLPFFFRSRINKV